MMSDAKARILSAIAALNRGQPVILLDDEKRENEGDLVLAAEKATAENVNFLIRNGSGIVCLCLPFEKVQALDLPLMVPDEAYWRSNCARFTVSIEAKNGVTTGVCAKDRATTIQTAIQKNAKPTDLHRPGHVFPLQASKGGLKERQGHTEGSIELVQRAGLTPASVICELMNPDGSIPTKEQIAAFALTQNLVILSIQDLLETP